MVIPFTGFRIKQIGIHRIFRQCADGERGNKIAGALSHNYFDKGAAFNEFSDQKGRFVCRYPAAYAKQDVLS